MKQVWSVRLGQQAEQDYVEILQWTVKTFGEGQASNYAETIALAIEALEGGPDILGARACEDIQSGIRTLHVARQGRAILGCVKDKWSCGRMQKLPRRCQISASFCEGSKQSAGASRHLTARN